MWCHLFAPRPVVRLDRRGQSFASTAPAAAADPIATAPLNARDATVCVVGAGGKKSTLFALADRLERAVVTGGVRIPIVE